MRAIIFPGQGAQFKGMGKDLFAAYPKLVELASDVLEYSIQKLCLEDPENKLKLTQYTQPALFVVNALAFYRMRDADPNNFKIDFLAGHSLGEYNALLAAGAFSFETGIRLVKKRGELMGASTGGKMAAVIGVPPADVSQLFTENGLTSIDLANYNTPTQSVIAGPAEAIEIAEKVFAAKGIRCVVLNVSAPFHSRYMKPASQEFASFLHRFSFDALKIPVIANATARPYENDRIAQTLATQVASPVLWTESIRYLMGRGCDVYSEVGSSILTKMVHEIRRTEKPVFIEDAGMRPQAGIQGEEKVLPVAAQASDPRAPDPRDMAAKRELACSLGSDIFCKRFGLQYAYVSGSMFHGISSTELVVRMAKAGCLGFFGGHGLSLADIENAIRAIQSNLTNNEPYGMNVQADYENPEAEQALVDLYLKHDVQYVEAASYVQMTPAIVLFRLKGLAKDANGAVIARNRVLAKVDHCDAAEAFMRPAPQAIVQRLLQEGLVNEQQAEWATSIPMSTDICVQADSGWRTNNGNPFVLLPAVLELRKKMASKFAYDDPICIGVAGGIGAPEAAAAAFMMGADFILTGSVNQCSVEAGISADAKNLLQEADIGDMEYAQAGEKFEMEGRFQVLKKGILFSSRANKLNSLYAHYNSIEEIPERTQKHLQGVYFRKSFADVWRNITADLQSRDRAHEIVKGEMNAKYKLALMFRWYFDYSKKLALEGANEDQTNYQIHVGPALGAFNRFAKGTRFERWQHRHVDDIAIEILAGAAECFSRRPMMHRPI